MPEQNRSLLKWFLLTFVTLGFYNLYFLSRLARDANIVCAGDGKRTSGAAVFFFLSLVTFGAYGFYWYYALGERMYENAPRYNLSFSETGGSILMFMLLGIVTAGGGAVVATYFLIRNMNELASAYNRWISGGVLPQPQSNSYKSS